eukprot:NODE_11_length_54881_cov_1.430718.p22 type:complete len:291 gc:universal NODE_11_length_54881_cov_1.430718:51258-50386(-)
MRFGLLVLTLIAGKIDFLDPLKQFYNKRILELALDKSKPLIANLINQTVIETKTKMVEDSPNWVKSPLRDILGLTPSGDLPKNHGIFQPLFDLVHKCLTPILNKWKQAIAHEVEWLTTDYEANLNSEIINSLRRHFTLRKRGFLDGLGKWYRRKVNDLIVQVVKILDSATHLTLLDTKDHFARNLGDHFLTIINWFMPDEWKIYDLDWIDMPMPKSRRISHFDVLKHIRNKIKEIVLSIQKHIQNFIKAQFDKVEESISVVYYNSLIETAKEKLPFYNQTVSLKVNRNQV